MVGCGLGALGVIFHFVVNVNLDLRGLSCMWLVSTCAL